MERAAVLERLTWQPATLQAVHRVTPSAGRSTLVAPGCLQDRPRCFVCGPTPFVEADIELLLHAGHNRQQIRAERFGTGRTSPT
jgi:ferredoxin-NADP reductase